MRDVWGLADNPRRQRSRIVGAFLLAHFGDQPITMSKISTASVRRFVLGQDGRSAGSIGVIDGAIGCYFRFRTLSDDRVSELAAGIPRAAHWRLASLPEVLTDTEIDELLRSFDEPFPSRRRRASSSARFWRAIEDADGPAQESIFCGTAWPAGFYAPARR